MFECSMFKLPQRHQPPHPERCRVRHANTLFVTTQGAYLARDHATLRVRIEQADRLTVPLHHLEGIVCFGRVGVSHGVYEALAERAMELSFCTEQGRFLARVV